MGQVEISAPNHFAISVRDIEESCDWYHRIFGFKIIAEWEIEELNTKARLMRLGDFELEFFKRENNKNTIDVSIEVEDTFSTIGLSHIAFTVESLDETILDLSEMGIELVTKRNRNPVTYDQWAFIKDPNGIFIELVEKP